MNFLVMGAVLLILGTAGGVWARIRGVYKRNSVGIEVYNGYVRAVGKRSAERLARAMLCLSLIAGFCMVCAHFFSARA